MVELKENVIYFLVGLKMFEISAYVLNRSFTKRKGQVQSSPDK